MRVLLCALLALSACACGKAGADDTKKTASSVAAPLDVEVRVVLPTRFETTLPATGTLRAKESVDLVAEVSRRLVRVRAEEGKRVKKGDVLFELDGADLIAELGRLEVQAALAKKTAERQTNLVRERVGTEADAERATAEVSALEASRRVLGVTLQKTSIRAPFDGTLGLRRVSEGAWVTPSTVLVTISDTSSLKLDFQVPERHAPSIRPGGSFRVRVDGRPEVLVGTISATEPGVDANSRSLTVRGIVENAGDLRPGTFAKVDLPLVVEGALLVPAVALQPSAEGRKVFVEKDGKVHLVLVEIGVRGPELVQVTSGLAAGDRVVTTNLLRLREGSAVVVKKETR